MSWGMMTVTDGDSGGSGVANRDSGGDEDSDGGNLKDGGKDLVVMPGWCC